jgi:hypothetical protein
MRGVLSCSAGVRPAPLFCLPEKVIDSVRLGIADTKGAGWCVGRSGFGRGDARQIDRDIAKTRQYELSMTLRKRVEMLFAHLTHSLGNRARLLAAIVRMKRERTRSTPR